MTLSAFMNTTRLLAVLACTSLSGCTLDIEEAGDVEADDAGALDAEDLPTVAANLCGASYVLKRSYPLLNGATSIPSPGRLKVYWSNATGKYCSVVVHTGAAYGVAANSMVSIATQTKGDYDAGTFKYYAGPVKVPALNKCAYTNGWIYWKGHTFESPTSGGKDVRVCN